MFLKISTTNTKICVILLFDINMWAMITCKFNLIIFWLYEKFSVFQKYFLIVVDMNVMDADVLGVSLSALKIAKIEGRHFVFVRKNKFIVGLSVVYQKIVRTINSVFCSCEHELEGLNLAWGDIG